MKKYLLLLLTMLTTSLGAWAEDGTWNLGSGGTVTISGSTYTINSTIAGEFATWFASIGYEDGAPDQKDLTNGITKHVVTGPVNDNDLTYLGWENSASNLMDLTGVTEGTANIISKLENNNCNKLLPAGMDLSSFSGNFNYLAMPNNSGTTEIKVSQSGGLTSALTEIGGNIQPKLKIYGIIYPADQDALKNLTTISELELSDVKIANDQWGNDGGTLDLSEVTYSYSSNSSISGTGTVTLPPSRDPYTVDGCNVTVNMANVEAGKTFAQIVAEAKAAMTKADATQTSFCSLTVQYAGMTNADLAVLGDADVAGATRIDLSGVTLASGASIDNIQLPSSLTQLVLPKDQTVSYVLASKLAAITGLNYAYSPSSDSQNPAPNQESSFNEAQNLIADYVWVNKAGGLAQAFTNETKLRNSYYIKVASNVELNATDVNFNALGDNKPSNYLFLDFSASNLTHETAAKYTVTDNIGYNIILPNDWSVDDMAVFAALPQEAPSGTPDAPARGNLAAVYSYSGTTLKIMEITDGKSVQDALKNPRIVRYGTTAIEVVGKLVQVSSESWNQYGDLGAHLIAALNQADDAPDDNTVNNIKTININVGQAYTILTEIDFTNTNIEHFVMSGVKNKNNVATGAGIDVSGCTSLKTIDVSNSTLQLLDAHGLTSLTSVDMSGTLMTNVNGLSGETILTGCTSLTTSGFVTNSSTQFLKDLKLINTGLTSFSTSAQVSADIYLNASSSLASIDLNSTQFASNWSGKVHIHATDSESDVNAIAALKAMTTGETPTAIPTISVPNGFVSADHIHPNSDVSAHIAETAASGSMEDSCDPKCTITYDAATKTATVHVTTAGHLANLMATNYAAIPEGTTFVFDNTSTINEADLKALAGNINGVDYGWRSNYYYVDLYDLTASPDLCNTPSTENPDAKGAIYKTIEWLRTNNRQFKGLILPKNHTMYGSGTTLIKDASNADPAQATCSEFIAYYTTGTSETGDEQLVAHIYNQSNTNTAAYQASFDKMKSMLATEVTTDADLYLISTNSQSKIDISSLPTDKTRIETINNEMVGTQNGKAYIYVYPDNSGAIKTSVDNTGIEETPTDLLQVNGAMNPEDFTAINSFTNGPRVLDLRNVTSSITKGMLESLTNDHIEYILLPSSMAKKTEVCTPDYSDLDGLKAVISSTSANCVAYVKTAGSLAEARYLATGGSVTPGTPKNIYSPAKVGLTSVTLAGNLNAADIGCNLTTYHTDVNGHWKNTSGDEASVGLSMETGITSIDLADAVFVNKATTTSGGTTSYADMNLSWAGLANLSDIKLPTSTEMKDIPESCCEGLASLKEICIPHNYEKIHNAAFLNTIVEHITTTDAKGTLVDNGPNTYTLSANLKQVGDAPADNTVGLTATQTVFPQNRPVFDCYVLATKTPICYKNAFPANMLYGWGGFDGTLPYCRDKYVNGTNYYCVLRFPSQESYNAVTDTDKKDTSYDLMKKQYTDVTKVYSKKEQTGAVDANGDEITWPTFSELRRAYNQATAGLTWNRWVANYDGQQEVNGGDNIPTEATGLTLGHYNSTNGTANNDLGDYTFLNYEGWHQFTLSQATYVEPDETPSETREYEDAGWFTFCIPYDMTMKQVREWLGVPASEGNVHCYYNNAEVTTPLLPDVRMLASVTRHTSTGAGNNNKVTFRLSTNLVSAEAGNFLNFDRTGNADSRWITANAAGNGSYDMDSKPCLRGGIPYIIKAYKRKGENIKSYNLGQYIMTRYGDQFKLTQACLNHGVKYYEYLGTTGGNLATLKFSKPYEEAIVVAANDAPSGGYCTYTDGDNTRDYEYALVGTFWNQPLPRYCFYQSKGKWYRNTNVNDYKWSAYKCVIMAVPYKAATSYSGYDGHNGQFYRENPSALGMLEENKSFYPSIEKNTTDKLNGTLKIVFADGRNDDDFAAAAARYSFAFDDDIVEYDDMGNEATAIDKLDCEDITPLPNNYKVYNMSGQYVGNSVNGLAKGMYVVNGKKYVIK